MGRLFGRRAKRAANAVRSAPDHVSYSYPVSSGRSGNGCAAGVIIGDMIVPLEGEPKTYPVNVKFGGNGQR